MVLPVSLLPQPASARSRDRDSERLPEPARPLHSTATPARDGQRRRRQPAIDRLIAPREVDALGALAAAGVVGFAGN
jgi:hypothetical protein